MKTKMFFLAGICAALAACSSDSDDVSSSPSNTPAILEVVSYKFVQEETDVRSIRTIAVHGQMTRVRAVQTVARTMPKQAHAKGRRARVPVPEVIFSRAAERAGHLLLAREPIRFAAIA